MKALTREPAQRYATAKEVAADLEEVLRKRGYGGKNDQIAKYMQATFSEHIVARKKLLQEVSSKGRASEDVLHAAFDNEAPSNPQLSGEFSVKFKALQAEASEVGSVRACAGRVTSPPSATPRTAARRIQRLQTQPVPSEDQRHDPPRPLGRGGLAERRSRTLVGVVWS